MVKTMIKLVETR